ncbi:CvfB family protein [Companilactobacillus metriopterae]|uniref:CvfB family protein n=1 Tax=Companilactobacillus metriopterae TaxID=1909267 RepID=UPI00100B8E8E|nr:S1-like domain-containing RNA-binding protein [Companilactobacillus metriopterae]
MELEDVYGHVVSGTVTDLNQTEVFVQVDGITFAMELEEFEETPELGDEVSGFAYENRNHKNKMTLNIPSVMEGVWGYVKVIDSRTDLGVFVDIGITDKDIVISLDDLPLEHSEWPKKDDQLLVKLKIDHKGRLWADMADINVYTQLARSANDDLKNKNITGNVIAIRNSGAFIFTTEYYLAFLHKEEQVEPLHIGQKVEARAIGSSHRRLNISMKPRAFEEITPDAQMIMAVLEHARENKMPYTDKSDPDDIREYFGISKASFKRALGNLMKQGKIEQKDGYTFLK